jgi:hypothetical protein
LKYDAHALLQDLQQRPLYFSHCSCGSMAVFERNGELLKHVNISVDEVSSPGFLEKVQSECRKKHSSPLSSRALAIFSHPTAKCAYLLFCVAPTNHYDVFGVTRETPERETRVATNQLMVRMHVDKWGPMDSIVQRFATEVTQFLTVARASLLNGEVEEEEAEEVAGDVDSEAEANEFFSKGDKKPKRRKTTTKGNEAAAGGSSSSSSSHGVITVYMSLRDMYNGKTVTDIKCGENKATVRVPPRSVPGWSTVLAPPGKKPTRVMFVAKPESMKEFYVDDNKRLCRNIPVEPINAMCGKGEATTTTPNGTVVKAKLVKPVNTGDVAFEFPGHGFGDDPMIGIANVRSSAYLSSHLRERLWAAYQHHSPTKT